MPGAVPRRGEWRWVGLLQGIFLIIALIGLDTPFVSTHYVRQCFSFDVAQRIFHGSWDDVINPKGSFTQLSGDRPDDETSPLNIPAPRSTICHLEFPFLGVLGWPAARVFPQHERAIVRLVAIAFAILSIRMMYLILRWWLEALPALLGTALWTFAPLVLHFGQVGMPDMLVTAGIAVAFYASLRSWLAVSSGAFLFTLLAKASAIPYGLPILVALALARNVGDVAAFVRMALAWGVPPAFGLAGLVLLGLHNPPGSWVIVGGYQPGIFGPVTRAELTSLHTYELVLLKVFPFGLGAIGTAGLLFAAINPVRYMDRALQIAIAVALLADYVLERIVWYEPQYTVPILFFLVIAASFGFPAILAHVQRQRSWRIIGLVLLLVHATIDVGCAHYLKASRVSNYPAIEAAAGLLPPDARVVAYCTTTNQVPPVWLHRNTLKFFVPVTRDAKSASFLAKRLEEFHRAGFDYLMVFEIEGKSVNLPTGTGNTHFAGFTEPSSPLRQLLDARHPVLFDRDRVVLYDLAKRR